MTLWYQKLRRASFGGVPFGVLGGELRVGRRNAVHTYPFKDQVWVEDLGRDARRITMTGFLVENGAYGGADVIGQRENMVAACESAGTSTLVHPTLGSLQVSLLDATFRERWDQGRVFEISFSFIEGGQRQFPSNDPATVDVVLQKCALADVAAKGNFLSGITSALSAGAAMVSMAVGTVTGFVSQVVGLAADATNLMNSVVQLPGSFGRFFGSTLRGIAGSIVGAVGGIVGAFTSVRGGALTVQSLIAGGCSARAAVSTACANLTAAANNLGPSTAPAYADAAQAVTSALLAATSDPGDALRVLTNLAGFTATAPTPTSEVGTAMATIQSASADLFRRAAVVCVARASAAYQPVSYDDAAAVRTGVAALLDAEIQIAGDQGEDDTYIALRAVRAAVVQDLTARGANLATLITITSPAPVPALTLAQRVYRDSSRSDELIAESACVHPAFMPTSFKGLAE